MTQQRGEEGPVPGRRPPFPLAGASVCCFKAGFLGGVVGRRGRDLKAQAFSCQEHCEQISISLCKYANIHMFLHMRRWMNKYVHMSYRTDYITGWPKRHRSHIRSVVGRIVGSPCRILCPHLIWPYWEAHGSLQLLVSGLSTLLVTGATVMRPARETKSRAIRSSH